MVSKPSDDQLFLKGAWSSYLNRFNSGGRQAYRWNGWS